MQNYKLERRLSPRKSVPSIEDLTRVVISYKIYEPSQSYDKITNNMQK